MSPLNLINEIILIDDASENRTYLYEPLDNFIKKLPIKIRIIHSKERLGLIRARMLGARMATGDTITFLDSHIEATNGWLPPLLQTIKDNRFYSNFFFFFIIFLIKITFKLSI